MQISVSVGMADGLIVICHGEEKEVMAWSDSVVGHYCEDIVKLEEASALSGPTVHIDPSGRRLS